MFDSAVDLSVPHDVCHSPPPSHSRSLPRLRALDSPSCVYVIRALLILYLFPEKITALAFMKEISETPLAVEHKILDVWVLLIIHGGSLRTKVESLFKKKIASGMFTMSLVRRSILHRPEAIMEMFSSLLQIAGLLTSNTNSMLRNVGGAMYNFMFQGWVRQEFHSETFVDDFILGTKYRHAHLHSPSQV